MLDTLETDHPKELCISDANKIITYPLENHIEISEIGSSAPKKNFHIECLNLQKELKSSKDEISRLNNEIGSLNIE